MTARPLLHEDCQRRGEAHREQARGEPAVQDCLLANEHPHYTEDNLSHETRGVHA